MRLMGRIDHRDCLAVLAIAAALLVPIACKRVPSGLNPAADSLAITERMPVDTVRIDGRRPALLAYTRDLEIAGTADSTAAEFVYNTRLLEVAPDGRVAVNTWQRLKVFDANGKFEWGTVPDEYRPGQLRNALAMLRKDRDGSVPRPNGWVTWFSGRATGAPGQLSDATSIVFSGDTVAVFDLPTGLHIFNRLGRSLAISPIVPRRSSSFVARVAGVGPTPSGWITLFRRMGGGGMSLELWRVSPVTGTLGLNLPYAHDAEASMTALAESYDIAAGAFYIAGGDDFTINVHDGFGRLQKRMEVATTRVQIPDSVLAARMLNWVRAQAGDTTSARARQMIDSARTSRATSPPQLQRVIGRLLVADDGSVAVERSDMRATQSASSDSLTFDILGADGTLRGRVRIPAALRPMAFSGSALYCVEETGLLPGTERVFGREVPRSIQRIVRLTLR